MAKNRVKRYDDGGDVEEGTGAQYESFGDAFKRNRASGEKTFEYKGKKYTTETAEDKAKSKAKEDSERERQSKMVKEEKGLERVTPELDLLPIGKAAGAMGAAATALKLGDKAVRAAKAARTAKRAESAAASGAMKGESAAGELRYKKGGRTSASKRADGCAIRGKTRA